MRCARCVKLDGAFYPSHADSPQHARVTFRVQFPELLQPDNGSYSHTSAKVKVFEPPPTPLSVCCPMVVPPKAAPTAM